MFLSQSESYNDQRDVNKTSYQILLVDMTTHPQKKHCATGYAVLVMMDVALDVGAVMMDVEFDVGAVVRAVVFGFLRTCCRSKNSTILLYYR